MVYRKFQKAQATIMLLQNVQHDFLLLGQRYFGDRLPFSTWGTGTWKID